MPKRQVREVAGADGGCKVNAGAVAVTDEASDIWRALRHYQICDPDDRRISELRDELIRRGDADAMYDRAVWLVNQGRRREAQEMMEMAAAKGQPGAIRALARQRAGGRL